MEMIWRDLRLALRSLIRHPTFSFVSVLLLTLGIAATTSIFSVVRAVLLKELPYQDPDRLVILQTVKDNLGVVENWPTSYLDFADWKDHSDQLESLVLYSNPQSFNTSVDGEAQRISAELVSADYFDLLGIEPVIGRVFTEEEDKPGAAQRVAVLSNALWKRQFGGDPKIIDGGTIFLNGESYLILGVLPPNFQGLTDKADAWVPVMLGPDLLYSAFLERRSVRFCNVAGRLAAGATLTGAREALSAIAAEVAAAHPDTNDNISVQIESLKEVWYGDLRFRLLTILGGAVLVLIVSCINIANLLLARAVTRQTEFSLRAALGAGRWRVVRQLLAESIVLSGFSFFLGLLLASLFTRLLVTMSGVDFKSFIDIGIDLPVAMTILAITLLCAVTFGMVPAVFLAQKSFNASLREGGKGAVGPGRRRFQNGLVIGEVALALFLLVGTFLMVKGFLGFRNKDLGYSTDILSARLDLKDQRYSDNESMYALTRQILERLNNLSEVSSAVVSGPGMPTDSWYIIPFYPEDRLSEPDEGRIVLPYYHVTPGYFSALGIPLLRGRDFGPEDTASTPMGIVISQEMERTYWPGGDAIGKRIRFSRRAWCEVIGVVADVENKALRQDVEWPGPDVYLGFYQYAPLVPTVNLMVKPNPGVAPEALASRLKGEIAAIAPHLPLFDIATFEKRLVDQTQQDRFMIILISLFAALALILAAVGLYGVISYGVSQRRREIGIRMALGARPQEILTLVLRQSMVLAVAGLVIGILFALGLNRAFESLLYGNSPNDILTLAGTALFLFLVTVSATFWPALKATRIEPTNTLRIE